MKLKKVIAVIVVLAVTVGAVTGGIYGYKSYQKKNLVAEVQSVSSLNYGYRSLPPMYHTGSADLPLSLYRLLKQAMVL